MSETWEAAELLEEIINNADPTANIVGMTSNVQRLTNNAQTCITCRSVSSSPHNNSVIATISYKVETIMSGVNGTPEEVVALLQTGLKNGQSASLSPDRTQIMIGFTIQSATLVQKISDWHKEISESLKKQEEETAARVREAQRKP